jgi:predicted GTPase
VNVRAAEYQHQARTKNKGKTKACRFGVIGLPNAGKSTLTNWLAGGTISAVSVRPETTRKPVLGAFTDGRKQAWPAALSAVAFW